jgi:GT2 family glycosyltransferase
MEQAPGPEISIVLCTRNRAAQLERTLNSLRELRHDGLWELVVVDNGSDDTSLEILEEFRRSFDGNVQLVQEVRPGLGRAHNAGLRHASGGLIAFIDDDCHPAPDLLTQIRDCFSEDPRLGFLGGRILLGDPTDRHVTVLASAQRAEFPGGSYLRPGSIQGANMAFRRIALEQVGGFDVRLGPGTPCNCEDIDTLARVCAAGWRGAYDPRPTVFHHHGRKTDAAVKALMRSYHRGRGAYYARRIRDPVTRAACLRQWARRWPGSPWRLFHEVSGFVHYTVFSLKSGR